MNNSLSITNKQFLQTIFGDQWPWAICTVFEDDPTDTSNRGLWAGDWAANLTDQLENPNANTFFTVSLFAPDQMGSPRRRKELFSATHVIAIDDVGTKVALDAGLPEPSYRLETSPGNEQWGYILDQPCRDQGRVDTLQDAIVQRVAGGEDPGQKGTTRYIRLPNGSNRKAKYATGGGTYPSHRLIDWHPERRFSMEGLMAFFGARETGRQASISELTDTEVSSHVFLKHLHVKKRLGEGRYDIQCPWVETHTDQLDNGSACMARPDGSIGFECHHGHCATRTGNDVVRLLQARGLITDQEAAIQFAPQREHRLSFLTSEIQTPVGSPSQPTESLTAPEATSNVTPGPWAGSAEQLTDQQVFENLKAEVLNLLPGENYRDILRRGVMLDPGYREDLVTTVADHMGTNRGAVRLVMRDFVRQLRPILGIEDEVQQTLSEYVYLAVQGRYVHKESGEGMKTESMFNLHSHLGEALKDALTSRDGITKVHNLSFNPGAGEIFERDGAKYYNLWRGLENTGLAGDITPWWSHLCALVPNEAERDHLLDYMAFTLQHPAEKINHCVILGGAYGNGKDTILWPLQMALGRHASAVDADVLIGDFREYLSEAKVVIFQEADLAGPDGKLVHNRLKTLSAAPPDETRVNRKGVEAYRIPNIVSIFVTTNEHNPLPVYTGDRRNFMIWSDLVVMGSNGEMRPEWVDWYVELWHWMKTQCGYQQVIHWLLQRDVTAFNPKAPPPMTRYREETIEANRDPIVQIVEEMLIQGLIPRGQFVPTVDAYQAMRGLVADWSVYGLQKIPSKNQFARGCRQAGAQATRKGELRERGWLFPELD